MSYSPTTPTLILCQNLATVVQSAWNPTAPSAVAWDYFRRYGDADNVSVAELQGRQVVFFPREYAWENLNRAAEQYTHHVDCLVVERYADAAGDPPRDWTSARVDFVHTSIVKGLRFNRSGPPSFNPALMTIGATVEVADLEKLTMAGKLFFALVQLDFVELVP